MHCGLKKSKLDLGILVSETPAAAAAMFTTNQVVAAPVICSRAHLQEVAHSKMRGDDRQFGQRKLLHGRRKDMAASVATARKWRRNWAASAPRRFWFARPA